MFQDLLSNLSLFLLCFPFPASSTPTVFKEMEMLTMLIGHHIVYICFELLYFISQVSTTEMKKLKRNAFYALSKEVTDSLHFLDQIFAWTGLL